MKRKQEELEEIEEVEEVSEEEVKKEKRKESVEKRKNAKKKDKFARWGGLVLLGLMLFVGFLLWVFGEMKQETQPTNIPINQYTNVPAGNKNGSIIVR